MPTISLQWGRNALPAALFALALLLQGCAGTGVEQAAVAPAMPAPTSPDPVEQLYAHHLDWRGTPYRLGGLDRKGIDCSGFIQRTFRDRFNRNLPRTTAALVGVGAAVPRDQLNAGDLVFFKIGRRTRHAGIYIEDGRFLHASTSQGVIISRLDTPYWARHYWTARRP
ncbi:NlpC/P60 family protein [Marinobacterium aestuariivivens]|uniref:NlpC/P60 family protein n=1 Tax=Marinobacterium aestuariivivens TaxID=1698799 RepID=A0ABW2A840_9GAMM